MIVSMLLVCSGSFCLLVSSCCFVVSGSNSVMCLQSTGALLWLSQQPASFLSSCCRNSLQKSLSALLIMTFFSHNQPSFFFESWGHDIHMWSQWVSWPWEIFFPYLSLSDCNLCVCRLLFVPPYRFRSLQRDPSPVRSSRAPHHTQVHKMLFDTPLHSSVTFSGGFEDIITASRKSNFECCADFFCTVSDGIRLHQNKNLYYLKNTFPVVAV